MARATLGRSLAVSAFPRYVQYFNFTYRHSGILWEGRYRATVVHSEQYLLTLMRYIELNPIPAGMVAYPGDYPCSSYRHNAYGKSELNADWWLMAHEEYLGLGRNKADHRTRGLYICILRSKALDSISWQALYE